MSGVVNQLLRVAEPLFSVGDADLCLKKPFFLDRFRVLSLQRFRGYRALSRVGNGGVCKQMLMTTEVQVKVMLLENWQEVVRDAGEVTGWVMQRKHWVVLNSSLPDDVVVFVPLLHSLQYPVVLGVSPSDPRRVSARCLPQANEVRVFEGCFLELHRREGRTKHQDRVNEEESHQLSVRPCWD